MILQYILHYIMHYMSTESDDARFYGDAYVVAGRIRQLLIEIHQSLCVAARDAEDADVAFASSSYSYRVYRVKRYISETYRRKYTETQWTRPNTTENAL